MENGVRASHNGQRWARFWRRRCRRRWLARQRRRMLLPGRCAKSSRPCVADRRAVSAMAPRRHGRLAKDERVFAILLLAPALIVLFATTTGPLMYLVWTSLHQANLSMPWISGFVGLEHFAHMLSDGRFWESLRLTAIYTITTVALQLMIGLAFALV